MKVLYEKSIVNKILIVLIFLVVEWYFVFIDYIFSWLNILEKQY